MPCNKKKGNKMLHELTDMKLKYQPKPINSHTSRFIIRDAGNSDPLWRKYLYFDNETSENNQWVENT